MPLRAGRTSHSLALPLFHDEPLIKVNEYVEDDEDLMYEETDETCLDALTIYSYVCLNANLIQNDLLTNKIFYILERQH